MSELVTGDAVVLRLRTAAVPSRALAMLIDVALQLAAGFTLVLLTGAVLMSTNEALGLTIMLVFVVLVLVGYPVLMEGLAGGRTLGKMALGLRVVRDDGGPIRFRHALTRGLAGFFVDFWALGLGGTVAIVVCFLSGRNKRVGDYLAGTVVISEKVPPSITPVLVMPPQLAAWAAALDLSALPDDVALSARQYLARWHQFSPAAQYQLGQQISEELANAIGAPVPPGTPHWAYLSAVLSERRNRERPPVAMAWNQPPQSQPHYQQWAAPQAQPQSQSQPVRAEPEAEQPFAPPS